MSMGLGLGIGLKLGGGGSPPPLIGPTIYAAPTALGDGSSALKPTTSTNAQRKARIWKQKTATDATVVLADGRYSLITTPLADFTDARDDGVTWQAASGARPLLSGGVQLTGWQLVDAPNDVWRAPLPAGVVAPYPLQLYVRGRRATRARGTYKPSGWTLKRVADGDLFDGFATTDTAFAGLAYPLLAHLVGSYGWKRFLVGISQVDDLGGSGANVHARPADWLAAQDHTGYTMDSIDWIEGPAEYVPNGHGFFAIDPSGVYYRPRPDEDMTDEVGCIAILPVQEQIRITADSVTFDGITFAEFGWTGPNAVGGMCSIQDIVIGVPPYDRIPGNIVVAGADGVAMPDCRFERMGGVGLSLELGARNFTAPGALFRACAASAVTNGDITNGTDDHHPSDDSLILLDNELSQVTVRDCAAQYDQASPILSFASQGTTIDRCNVEGRNYAFSHWGSWGRNDLGGTGWPTIVTAWTTPRVERNLSVSNSAFRFGGLTLSDVGIVYTNGDSTGGYGSNGATYSGNWISGIFNTSVYGVYLDNAAGRNTVSGNAIANLSGQVSVHFNQAVLSGSITEHDNTVTGNEINTTGAQVPDAHNANDTVSGNVAQTTWTAAGLRVIRDAGLTGAYLRTHGKNVAVEWTASAFASSEYHTSTLRGSVIDGRATTYWRSADADTSAWIVVDLGCPHDLNEIVVMPRMDDTTAAWRRSFKIQVAESYSGPWTDVYEQGDTPVWPREMVRQEVSGSWRYVRVIKTAAEPLSLAEILVYGCPTDATVLWRVDTSDWPVGAAQPSTSVTSSAGAGGGTAFARGGNAIILPSSDSTDAQVSAGIAGVAQYGSDATRRGLSFFGAQTRVYGTRDPNSSSTFPSAGSGLTATPGAVTSPLGTDTSTVLDVTSGGYSRYGAYGVTAGAKYTLTFWVLESPSNPGSTFHYQGYDGSTTNSAYGTATAAWKRVRHTFVPAGSSLSSMPLDGRAGTGGNPPAAARRVALDVMQFERGAYPTPFSTSGNRAAESIYHPAMPFLLTSDGAFDFEVDIDIAFSAADFGSSPRYLWCDKNDATTYVRIETDLTVSCSVGGSSISLPTAIPNTFVEGDRFVLRVKSGAGSPTGSVTINGVTTSLGTGSGTHTALTSLLAAWMLCNGTSGTLESRTVPVRTAYA